MSTQTFAVVSDIHYGPQNDLKDLTQRLNQMVHWLESQDNIDSLFILGDLLNSQNTSKLYAERHLKSLANTFKQTNLTISVLAGDHDVNITDKYKLEHYFNKVQGIRRDYIGLDTSWEDYSGPHGKIDTTVLRKNNLPKHPIIFSHHPIVPWELSDNPWFDKKHEMAYAINKEEIWDKAISKLQPRLIVNGHIKQQKAGTFDGIPAYSTNPFNQKYPDTQNPTGHFYTITQTDEQMIIVEHVAEPNTVHEKTKTHSYELPNKLEQHS